MDQYREFDEDQQVEIRAGLDKGLDVSLYAKPEFLAIQMRQIRLGLEDKLDVTVYNKVEYDWFQMEEIRKGLRDGLRYELYANPSVDYKRMRQIRKGLKQGIDLSIFIKLDAGILEELRKAIRSKVAIVEYIREGYDVEQLEQIRIALEKKLNIRPYISVEFRGPSIHEIALGLEKGLPVLVYADMEYNWQQMREIRLGLEARLDVKYYSNSLYNWQQMREIRLGLEEGLDVSKYNSFIYTFSDMEKARNRLMEQRIEHIVGDEISEISDDQIAVFVSNDHMEACVEIHCEDTVAMSVQELLDRLKIHGVCKGFLMDEIECLVKEKKYNETIVVARGQAPVKGEDGRYEFYFNTNPTKTPKIKPDGSVDFRDTDWFEMVEEGQKIACYIPAQRGFDGYTVTGDCLAAKKGREKVMISGKGFELLSDGVTYISSMNGKIDLIGESRIEISRVCIVENVNLSTGNINFDGNVYVTGNVECNSMIYATENIVVNGYVESSTLRCGGEICLRKGVNGGGTGLVEAGSDVRGHFFEDVRVISGGDIVAGYALNCEMYATGTISCQGVKGLLLGGFIRAARGVSAHTIGNKVGVVTRIDVGVDAALHNQMQSIEYKIANVNQELAILRNSFADFQKKYPAEVRNTMDIFLKIESAIYTKELQMKGLQESKERLEQESKEMRDAKVVVKGILYEGTDVVINNVRWPAFTVKDVAIKCVGNKVRVESGS